MYSLADRAAIRNGNTMEGGEGDFTSQWGLPAAPAKPVSIAFLLGCSDGEASRPIFAPELYFVRQVDKIQYAFGFEASCGASEMTRQFTASVNWSNS